MKMINHTKGGGVAAQSFRIKINFILIAVFFLAIISGVQADDQTVTKEISVPPVKIVQYSNKVNFMLVNGESRSLKIETSKNFIENVEAFVANETLYIRINSDSIPPVLNVYLTLPETQDIEIYEISENTSYSDHFLAKLDLKKMGRYILDMFLRM